MRDHDPAGRIRDHDRPEQDEHDGAVEHGRGERDECGKEGDDREDVGREDVEAHRVPFRSPGADRELDVARRRVWLIHNS